MTADSKVRRALTESERELLDAEETQTEKAEVKAQAVKRLGDLKEEWQENAIPSDLIIPRGEEVSILQFKAEHCKGIAKDKGNRSCVLWPLSVTDERVARQRMFGDATRGLEEMAKAMIRAIDGKTIKPEEYPLVEKFWDEIGPRHRSMLVGWYQKTHNFDDGERLSFFVDCVAVRTAH
jgi:hypothetical protein